MQADPSNLDSDVTYDHAAAHANIFKSVASVGKFRLVFVPLLFSITIYSFFPYQKTCPGEHHSTPDIRTQDQRRLGVALQTKLACARAEAQLSRAKAEADAEAKLARELARAKAEADAEAELARAGFLADAQNFLSSLEVPIDDAFELTPPVTNIREV